MYYSLFYLFDLQGFWHAHKGDENEELRNTLKSISDDLDDMTYLRPAWKKVSDMRKRLRNGNLIIKEKRRNKMKYGLYKIFEMILFILSFLFLI